MEVYLQLTDFIKFLEVDLFHINLYDGWQNLPPAIQVYAKSPNFDIKFNLKKNQSPRIRLSNLKFTFFDFSYMPQKIDKIWEAHLVILTLLKPVDDIMRIFSIQYIGQLKVSEPRGSKVVKDAIDMVKV